MKQIKNAEDYIDQACRTMAPDNMVNILCGSLKDFDDIFDEILLHGVLGLCTETGELQDLVKKKLFYGKEIEPHEWIEELGDAFWYMAILCAQLNVTFEYVWQVNIDKLRTRYPEKFTTEKALNRNLEKEKTVQKGKRIKSGYIKTEIKPENEIQIVDTDKKYAIKNLEYLMNYFEEGNLPAMTQKIQEVYNYVKYKSISEDKS